MKSSLFLSVFSLVLQSIPCFRFLLQGYGAESKILDARRDITEIPYALPHSTLLLVIGNRQQS